jgi:hypothetical protein
MPTPSTSTETRIAAITDAGEFERMATSVLRVADPLYRDIVHTGVNAAGQTIVDPLDGISICVDLLGNKYAIAAEHTITAKAKIFDKWLNDIDGDLIKAIKKLKAFHKENPAHKLRVVLTSKVTPSSDLVTSAHSIAGYHSVELDIWSNDKLANTLDISPDGQAIRNKFFGTSQTRLSRDLAAEISRKQVSRYAPPVPESLLVSRSITSACPTLDSVDSPLVFLTGGSGAGKSALCFQISRETIASEGLVFVVSHESISSCDTLGQALRKSIVNDVPSLVIDNPLEELIQISQGREVLVWIEDVNVSKSPVDLLLKLDRSVGELSSLSGNESKRTLLVLCPIWPENLQALPNEASRKLQARTAKVEKFSVLEAREAVKRREAEAGSTITDFEADQICERFDRDPLLIGLWVGQQGRTEPEIIAGYVDDCLTRCSRVSSRSVSSLRRSAHAVAHWMLENRSQAPTLDTLYDRFGGSRVYSDLEAMCAEGGVFNEVIKPRETKLGFRHDRVRDYLLIEAMAEKISREASLPDYLTDPFYTELVARAALRADVSEEYWDRFQAETPLLCFCALKHALREKTSHVYSLQARCEILIENSLLNKVSEPVRRAIEWQIASFEGCQFAKLTAATRANFHAGIEARVVNGEVKAAAALCYSHEPTVSSPYRDRLVAHAREKHGEAWTNGLDALIREEHQTEEAREAVLYLAGECADVRLADAVYACWKGMNAQGETISMGILFAAVACGSGANGELIKEVFDAWRALPADSEEKNKPWKNNRFDVAKYCLAGGMRRIVSERTIEPLLRLANEADEMKHIIYWCLEQIDHPLAASFVASHIAKIDARMGSDENQHNYLASTRLSDFGSGLDHHVRYTERTMDALKATWSDTSRAFFERKRSFQLWRGSIGRKQVEEIGKHPPRGLENEALLTRCRLGDTTAIPKLRAKILDGDDDGVSWFQFIRQFDSCYFEDLILQKLEARSVAFLKGEQPNKLSDYIIPHVLAERCDDFAERTLIDHWHHLSECWEYPHLLLYLATPRTLELFASHYQKIGNKTEHFKLLCSTFGIRHWGRSGLTKIEQLKGLEPYLKDFDDQLISTLWEECNEKGFEEWRKNNLDHRLAKDSWAFKEINEEAAFAEIDAELERDRSIELVAYSWAEIRGKRTNTTEALIERARRYVDSRKTVEAAGFLAQVISLIGKRVDSDILKKYECAELLTAEEIEAADFSVRMRSLV